MFRFFPRLLLLCGLLYAGAPVWTDALSLAEQALRDRMTRLAETRFREVIASSQDAVEQDRARAGLARSLLLRGDLDTAGEVLRGAADSDSPPVVLLRTDLALLRGEITRAASLLETIPILEGEWEILRLRLRLRLLMAQGDLETALTEWQAIPADPPPPAPLRLEAAELLIRLGQIHEARELRMQVAGGAPDVFDTQYARILLAQEALTGGQPEAALEWVRPLVEKGGLHERLEPEVYPLWIRGLEARGDHREAVVALEAFERRTPEVRARAALQTRRAVNLLRAGDAEAADRLLRALIAEQGDLSAAGGAQLLLGRARLEAEQPEAARAAYQNYLSVFTDPAGQLEARLGLAAAEEQLGNAAAAELLLEQTWNSAPADSPLRPQLLLKWADLAFARGRMVDAATRCRLFLDRFPGHELTPRVLLLLAQTEGQLDRLAAALDVLTRLQADYPDSEYAERALLQRAVLLDRALRLEQALGAYDAYLDRYPQGKFAADALTEKAIAAYRLRLFDLALHTFREVLTRFPAHPRAEQAACLRGWATYLNGNDEEARRLGEAFLLDYPNSRFAGEVRFWLAEMSFNRGEYAKAADAFQKLAGRADAPDALRARAHDLAGRALRAQKQPEAALAAFQAAAKLAADPRLAAEARFSAGDALTELDRYDEALLAFEQIIRDHPTVYLVPAARGRMGDCQYTLGSKDPKRFLEALNSYRLVEEIPDLSPELRLQALYKIGRTLFALERPEEGREHLLRTIQLFMRERERLGREAGVWFVRAVTDAAQSYEEAGDYREAIGVYRQLVDSGLPQAAEGARRIEELRREHFILF